MKNLLYILLFVPLALFGQENYSLTFDGVDDEVLFTQSNDLLIHNDISILLDIKIQSISGYQTILAHANYGDGDGQDNSVYLIEINNNTLQYVHEYGNGSNVVVPLEDNLLINHWYRLALIRNSSESRIDFYINNSLVSSQDYNISPEGGDNGVLQFGRLHGETGAWYHGFIDNINIWSSALNQSDVNAYMNCPPSGYEDGLVGYWNFNEGSGDTVYDLSVNGNDGTIFGATYSQVVPENNCVEGCVDTLAVNYNDTANVDDGSCVSVEEYTIDSLEMANQVLSDEATNAVSSLQQALDTWNTTIDLDAGWNMFGYGCPNPIDVAEGLSNHTESIAIVKDNNGAVYLPEWDFNGIGDLTPGFGYQIKVTEPIEGFSLCDWYVNDIPEDNIISLQEENDLLNNENESLQAELDYIYGCIDENACNYDDTASIDDGTCYNNDLGCGCDTPGPIEGYDCDGICIDEQACNYGINETECLFAEPGYNCYGNEVLVQIGEVAYGGIVFYIDSTGQHGLVAATEDLDQSYEWGCYGEDVNGADATSMGSGYQNTMDIINQGCPTEYGGITAAQAALDSEINGYSDWYLPSKDELSEMWNTIGNGGPEGNIGDFEDDFYWSSSECNDDDYNRYAGYVYFGGGNSSMFGSKTNTIRVRVIRAF